MAGVRYQQRSTPGTNAALPANRHLAIAGADALLVADVGGRWNGIGRAATATTPFEALFTATAAIVPAATAATRTRRGWLYRDASPHSARSERASRSITARTEAAPSGSTRRLGATRATSGTRGRCLSTATG